METRMTKTSIDAYNSVELNKRQNEVVTVFNTGLRYTAKEVASRLHYPINRVTGRINELRFVKQVLVADGTKKVGKVRETLYRLRRQNEDADKRPLSISEQVNELVDKYGAVLPFGFIAEINNILKTN
jgi:hypothetical protein